MFVSWLSSLKNSVPPCLHLFTWYSMKGYMENKSCVLGSWTVIAMSVDRARSGTNPRVHLSSFSLRES